MDYYNCIKNIYYFNQLKKSSRSEIKKIRENNLKDILNYAIDHSAFYKDLYKNAGIEKKDLPEITLKDLPVTNKKMLMDNFDEVITDKRLKINDIFNRLNTNPTKKLQYFDQYEIIHTSGTSGLIGIFPIEIKNLPLTIAAINTFLVSPIKFLIKNFKRCRYVNCVVIGARAGTVISSYATTPMISKRHLISTLDPLEKNIEKLNVVQPDIISGYSSSIKSFAESKLEGKLKINPTAVVCSGDAVDEDTKNVIYQAFGIYPMNYYASSENLFMGFKQHEDYFSILDPLCYINGETVSNLYNKIFPIINYKSDDIFDHIEDYSQNPFTKVKLHSERSSVNLKFFDNFGKYVTLSTLYLCSLHVDGMHAFQFSKSENNTLHVKVEGSTPNLQNDTKIALVDILKRFEFDRSIHLKIDIVDKIPLDPKTGKFKAII